MRLDPDTVEKMRRLVGVKCSDEYFTQMMQAAYDYARHGSVDWARQALESYLKSIDKKIVRVHEMLKLIEEAER